MQGVLFFLPLETWVYESSATETEGRRMCVCDLGVGWVARGVAADEILAVMKSISLVLGGCETCA